MGTMGSPEAAAAKTGKKIAVFDVNEAKAKALAEEHGAAFAGADEIAAESRMVFLAVKPHIIEGVCRELGPRFAPETLLVTMAAGKTAAQIAAGAKFYLAGHTHSMLARAHKGIVLLNAETTCRNFDSRPFGFRLLTIRPDFTYTWDFHAV